MKNNATFKYIGSLLLFGSNGIVASRILLSSQEIVLTRTLIGALSLVLMFAFSGQKMNFGKDRLHALYLTASGAALGASWIFLFEAYNQIGVSIATLAYYCGPVIVMILSPALFNEKVTPFKVAGFMAVIVGMLCANEQALVEGQVSWGLLLGTLSAFSYALMVIFNKKATSITGLENPMWQLIASFITVAIFVGWKQGFSIPISSENVLPVLLLGVLNTGVGCYLYFSAMDNLPVQTASILGYLEPLSALFFSTVFLGESLNVLQFIGASLILGGAAFGEILDRKKSFEFLEKPGCTS